MGIETRKEKAPPLPAPTETSETDSTIEAENAEADSRVTEKSTYSLPEDGSPVTIATRKKKHHNKENHSELASNNKSQTSLLIEYFEGGKEDKTRRPSVRITERKGTRRPSYTQRIPLSPRSKEDRPFSPDDENSMASFRSMTEESNVTSRSGRPIEVEIMRHGSPLIPTEVGSRTGTYNASEISSMPADSFLDGYTRSPERKRSRSLTRSEALVAGAATGLAAGAAADKLRAPSRRRSRSLSRERIVAQKAVEKVRGDRSERRRKHRSRSRSASGEQLGDAMKSPRRRSSRSHVEESMLSGADSSAVSRNSGKYSFQSATSKSSINNPKLLETVEDAIRRLILPELKELKREQSLREPNGGRRTPIGSGVSKESKDDVSRPKVVLNDNEVLSGNTVKGRKGKSIGSVPSFERDGSEETVTQEERVHKKRSGEKNRGLEAAAAGALTAAALEKHQSQEPVDEKKERRRRRKNHSRGNSLGGELREERLDVVPPPMPLMSDMNASDITRTSILSAETERPDSAHSASQERITPVKEVSRGVTSPSSITPTRTPVNLQHGLGTQHSNFSRGNLSLKSQNSDQRVNSQEYDLDEHGRKVPMQDHHDPDLDDSLVSEEHNGSHSNNVKTGITARVLSPALDPDDLEDSELLEDEPLQHLHPYYQNTQEVPPPLRYVPYGHERRGLSPIQSVSGYTENEDQQLDNKRDSKVTQSTASYSSLSKAALHRQSLKSLDSNVNIENRHDFSEVRQGSLSDSELTQENEYWEEQHRENDRNRDLDSESFDGRYDDGRIVSTGQDIKGVGGKPNYVNTPIGVESAVASLVNASEITGTNSYPSTGQYDRRGSFASFEDDSERNFTSRGNSPTKSPTKFEDEYELDENGRKVAKSQTTQKLGGAALGATAAALLARAREKMRNEADQIKYEERGEHTGAPPEKSFKDRTMDGQKLLSPRHSVDALSEASIEKPVMGFNAIPTEHNLMPEVGYGDADSDVTTNPSIIQGPIGGTQQGSRERWSNKATPPQARRTQSSDSTGLKEAEAAVISAAMGAGAGAALANHNREHSQDDDEWRRTSSERKRDTLITNPYEDTSPIAALGNGTGLDREILNQVGLQNASRELNNRLYPGSPGGLPKDEGYISSAPNARSAGAQTPELNKGKGLAFMDKDLGSAAQALGGGDGFYPKHSRNLSGMSDGMDSPLYDSATGNGMDRIQSKDIVALMDHLTVRDAQRSARDTEILVTLVRAAAEMRNSFEDMKRLLADTEDVIITEVQVNTERSVQKVINGPRPLPPSAPRSIRSQGEMYEDLPTKRRNVFRRALKGLSKKSTNDLGKIEDMLVQLLGDVEGLKVAQGLQPESNYYEYPPEGRSEPDRGYEPEGNAGTSTASHGSQSGHLSIPQSRGPSGKGFEGRKFSDHRISTVPEGDEDEGELDPHEEEILNNQFENNEALLTPTHDRGESVPLDTPPQQFINSGSLSNENTPRTETEKTKKHKSSSSSGWIPKVSRWSETTASTVFKGFRSSGRNSGRKETEQFNSPPPRSDSGLGTYNTEQEREQEREPSREMDRESERTVSRGNYAESEPEDKLHSGFSQEQLHQQFINDELSTSLRPPEDPKYKAHRNSINLQHPQPRPGPTHRYQTHLESQAQNYDHAPMSPSSLNWGSSTSLNRLPPHQNRYSQATTNTERNLSPISDGGYSDRSASGQAPARPPKEPIVPEKPLNIRNKLQKPSPLSNEHLNAGLQSENSYESSSTQSASRRLSGALGAPTRKPTGPRSMSTASKSGELNRDDGTVIRRNKNRDTFGTIASHHTGESETF
ncbi:hypothetical protein ACMFMG_009215 [Clarireedia jacksonii]